MLWTVPRQGLEVVSETLYGIGKEVICLISELFPCIPVKTEEKYTKYQLLALKYFMDGNMK